ncbi:hypothetical protein TrCOL_g12710 [Triparma columacea]|uniref:Uncharacterized protein n=1 Tax=Triparma columacea TaxID=722753 RepID=A0A9W7GFH1_9STRA|nr:hypothetical protein TrCOL_g12710 [Triparma columacea]
MPLTKPECEYLHDKLGDSKAIPKQCLYQLIHKGDEVDTDKSHGSSWLWPSLARRATRGSHGGLHEKHPQNWLKTHISPEECAEVKDAMKAAGLPMDKLPEDCK